MFRNLLKVSLRNLLRHKSFTIINIISLSVGLASAVLIASTVREDLLWDHFNKNFDNIYRVVQIQQFGGVESQHVAFNQYPLVPAMTRDLAEVETGTRYKPYGRNLVQTDPDKPGLFIDQIVFVDSTFFDVFSYEFAEGNRETALSRPENAVLTQDAAQRLFGDENPLGRELTIFDSVRVVVAGVLKKPSRRSHQKFDILLPIYSGIAGIDKQIDKWGGNTLTAYVQLRKGTDPKEVERKFPEFIKQYRDIEGVTFYLQALKDFHLRSTHIKYDHQADRSSERDVLAYIGIGVLLLLIAGINFVNLSTAQSLLRAREVAVRKINGASRWTLIRQFITEALLLAVISMVLAGVIAQLAAPGLSSFFGRQVDVKILDFGFNTFSLLILSLLLGLAAGIYPSIVLSSFHPVTALRGSPFKGPKGIWLRRGLIIFQFALAVVLMIATAVIYRQLSYAHSRDLGYNREQVILLRNSDALSATDREHFRDRIAGIPGVVSATIVSDPPVGKTSQSTFQFQGITGEGWMASYSSMDPEALQTFGLRMAEGRWFSKDMSTDESNPNNPIIALVLNQTAVKSLGLEHPIGMDLKESGWTGHVIGVVQDFYSLPLNLPIEPFVLFDLPSYQSTICVRLESEGYQETLVRLEQTWETIDSKQPFDYTFLDDLFERLYTSERTAQRQTTIFSLLAVLVASIGLFGLASFTIARRTRELGIRKVLGATEGKLLVLVIQEFLVLILIANLIAWPLGGLLMKRWLDSFAYNAGMPWWLFPIACVVSAVTALLTILVKAWHTTQVNPATILRYE